MQQKSLRSLTLSLCTLFAFAVATPGCDQLGTEDFRFNATGPCGDGGTVGGSESDTGGLDESSGDGDGDSTTGDGDGDGDAGWPGMQICRSGWWVVPDYTGVCPVATVHACFIGEYSQGPGFGSVCCDEDGACALQAADCQPWLWNVCDTVI
jgi:hypothetical protein